MENYLNILIEAVSSFGWKEYLCVMIASALSAAIGVVIHFIIREIKGGSGISSVVSLLPAVILAGLICPCITSFWNYPAEEMKTITIIWLLIWFAVGWFEPVSDRLKD